MAVACSDTSFMRSRSQVLMVQALTFCVLSNEDKRCMLALQQAAHCGCLQAEVLNVDLQQLQEAVSIACRLGFGTRRERLQPVASHRI